MATPGNSSFHLNTHGPVFCEKFTMQVITSGVFSGKNPTQSALPLLLLQLGLISLVSGLLHFMFKPLGMPKQVTDILSGIIMGPSFLGQNKRIYDTFYTTKGLMVLDVYETLSMILFSFVIGLRTDLNVIKRAGGLALAMGISCSFIPIGLNTFGLYVLNKRTKRDENDLRASLSVAAGLENLINFHVVFTILTDNRIVNTDLGRTALSSSMISGMCSWILIIGRRVVRDAIEGQVLLTVLTPLCRLILILFIIYIVRPMMFWMMSRIPEGKTLKQSYVCIITLIVFGVAFYSEVNGMHPIFSSIFLGLAVPDGSSLQSGLVDKLEGFVYGVLLPSYIVNVGRRVDVYRVNLRIFGYIEFLVALAFLGKLAGSMLVSTFWNLPVMDAILIGLLVSCQGIFDIQFFSIAEKTEKLSVECFTIMVIMAIFLSSIVTPLVGHIYNPTRQFRNYQKRRIQATRHNVEFGILACVHQEDTVPTLINILEASNPTKKSPIAACVLDLVELVGQTIPLFISHKLKRNPSSRSNRTQRIIRAFYQYESQNEGFVNVQCYTSVAPFTTIHNDICVLALEKSASLIILSQDMACGPTIRTMNLNVLANAPCSVAILVDRRALTESRAALRSWLIFHACLIFIGGADDREALVYASRMCEHASVSLTIIHITEIDEPSKSYSSTNKKLDLNAMEQFKDTNIYNNRVYYRVETVTEGTDTVRVLQSLNHVDYDLLMVGRRHNAESRTMSGLVDWSEKTTDLGIIGDILVSPDIRSKAAVMIVQEHISDQEPDLLQSPPLTPTRQLTHVKTVDDDLALPQ